MKKNGFDAEAFISHNNIHGDLDGDMRKKYIKFIVDDVNKSI